MFIRLLEKSLFRQSRAEPARRNRAVQLEQVAATVERTSVHDEKSKALA